MLPSWQTATVPESRGTTTVVFLAGGGGLLLMMQPESRLAKLKTLKKAFIVQLLTSPTAGRSIVIYPLTR